VTVVTSIQEDGRTSITRKVRLSYILENFTPGDEHTWNQEFAWLEMKDSFSTLRLVRYSAKHGLPNPESERITLGADGRVWDGHHRIYAASVLGIEEVEVLQWIGRSGSGSSEV
jgi:hypothetical protein